MMYQGPTGDLQTPASTEALIPAHAGPEITRTLLRTGTFKGG